MAKKGLLQYYGLDTWWRSALTSKERERVEACYHEWGNPHPRPLTEQPVERVIGITATPTGLLCGLIGAMRATPEDRVIRRKIREKLASMCGPNASIAVRHNCLYVLIQDYYRDRLTEPTAMAAAIDACRQQIAIAPLVAMEMRVGHPWATMDLANFAGALPNHLGYYQLSVILMKEHAYDEAIRLCEEAKRAGWNGDWDKRIARCAAAKAKAGRSKPQ